MDVWVSCGDGGTRRHMGSWDKGCERIVIGWQMREKEGIKGELSGKNLIFYTPL